MAKRDKERLIPREVIKEFIKERNIKTIPDIQNALKEMFGETLQELLEAEMNHNLGYEKNDSKNKQTENRRNGHTPKTVRSEFGEIDLEIPRDREGEFDPIIVKKNQRNVAGIEEQIIALYAKGVSVRDIQDHLQRLYGIDASPALISNITNKLMPVIKEWQNRPLHSIYAVIFMDAIHYNVREDGMITKKAAYVIVGIDLDGKKDVLGIWIGENESAKFWLSVLNELRNRGVEDILIISVDNLKGFSEAIAACYPETKIQKCIVHQIRNSLRYVSYRDLKKLAGDLRPVYTASSEEAALEELNQFESAWGEKYPLIIRSWRQNWAELATFFDYPPSIRRIIYTTNIIESFHRQLRKVTKSKSIFPTDEALLKMLYLATQDVLIKWTGRIPSWGQVLLQLSICFPDKVKPHLS